MKLRVRENSIRLRLLQSEIKTLEKNGIVSENITFSATQKLVYTIRISKDSSEISARFEDNKIAVKIPAQTARHWIETDLVGLEMEQKIDNEMTLKILIEKDFVCLERPFDKDNTDAFPHPIVKC